MPKYLLLGSYTVEGAKGLLNEGGSKRRAAVEKTLKGLGGRLEAFYFAFGECDAVTIIDVPDQVSAVALALTIKAAGAAHAKTIVLVTPEEVDQATKKTVSYRPPVHR